MIAKANSLGFTPYFSWTDTILAIPSLGFFLITNWPCTVGGELKNVKRSLPIGVVGAGLFAWVMFFITAALYYWVLGSDFASSIAYLTVNSPANSPFSSNLLTTVIQYVYGWNWVTIFIAFSLICACFIVIAQSIFLSDRHVLAWAFDNVIPNKFASINDKWGTPVFTTIVLWIVSEIVLLVLLFQSSAIGLFLNAGVGVAMGYAPALLAATLFSRRRKDLIEGAPSMTRYKVGGTYLVTIAGAIGFIGFVAIVIFTALFPQIGYPVTPFNIGFMMLLYLLGLVVYYAGRSYRKGQGIDIELAFKQIPPE